MDTLTNSQRIVCWFSLTAGCIGWIISGILINKFQSFKKMYILLGLMAFIMTLLLIGGLELHHTAVYIVQAFMGFSCFPCVAIWYIYAADLAYPLKETTVTGVFMGFSETFGALITYLWMFELKHIKEEISSVICIIIVAAFLCKIFKSILLTT